MDVVYIAKELEKIVDIADQLRNNWHDFRIVNPDYLTDDKNLNEILDAGIILIDETSNLQKTLDVIAEGRRFSRQMPAVVLAYNGTNTYFATAYGIPVVYLDSVVNLYETILDAVNHVNYKKALLLEENVRGFKEYMSKVTAKTGKQIFKQL